MFGAEQRLAVDCGAEQRKRVTQGTSLQLGIPLAAHFAQLLVFRDAGDGGSIEVSRYIVVEAIFGDVGLIDSISLPNH